MRIIRQSTVMVLFVLCLGVIPAVKKSPTFPDTINLPTGFRPEGITIGRQTTFYTGSLANGAIYRGDLLTGKGDVFIEGENGKVSVGMAYDTRSDLLFVAGGSTGMVRVFNATTGDLMASYQLAGTDSFINDVVITPDAAFFTNSFQPLLYRFPLKTNGNLPDADEVETISLSGEWQQGSGFGENGIEASPDGQWLVIVHSTRGELYRVDPSSGASVRIDLGSESVSNGDGLRFQGSLLYVMRNRNNELVAIDLSENLTSGTVVKRWNQANFDVPTTLAAFGNALYTVNAKFTAPDPSIIPFEVVRISIK